MHYQWGFWCKGSKFIWKAKKFNVKNIESTVQNILAFCRKSTRKAQKYQYRFNKLTLFRVQFKK